MIYETLAKYHELSKNDKNHRFKSWEHCYSFFSQNYQNLKDEKVFDHACLHLAFYLASWGMLRGSSFLLQKDYKVHSYFLRNVVMNADTLPYFDTNSPKLLDQTLVEGIDELIRDTKNAYQDNIYEINGERTIINVTDTLASKILLGVYGNVPAYDRYFKEALAMFGIRIQFNQSGLRELIDFYNHNIEEFEASKAIFSNDGIDYTPMKLIDMFFWQVGFMRDNLDKNIDELKKITEFAAEYKAVEKNEYMDNKIYQTITELKIMKKGLTDEIRRYIITILNKAHENGADYLDLRSGDIHKAMGLKDRLPSVCGAMESLGIYQYSIIKDTPSGKSSTRVVRYFLSN
ncbi:hypothetical protein E1I69_13380 [Bacillus timonensis]|uniref:Uncharacterized protein n=1 Tax=Bacillus timonensis TaxID=1033734 RepID=A0A4V3V7T0_9BACI|nr:hypothetical protein [Bacillus timonensis]THE11873.1 hypothetical protein E1I69_13380 [Bacillus timonensis]